MTNCSSQSDGLLSKSHKFFHKNFSTIHRCKIRGLIKSLIIIMKENLLEGLILKTINKSFVVYSNMKIIVLKNS